MKNNNLINYCLICFLIFLILYNLLKYRETIENKNNCPSKEELNKLKEENRNLNLKLNKTQKIIENNKIESKINSVKSFCDEAKSNFEKLNEKVTKTINSMKDVIKKNQEKS